VESLQDKSSSGSHSLGLSAGYSESKDSDGKTTSSGNFGGNFSVSSSTKKWVSEQTSLTGNSVNIYVENKTTLKGAVIASTSNDLTLDTGSFEYIHIKDKDISYNFGGGANAGANYTGKPDEKNNTWSVNASYGFSQKRQTNFATIGEGTIIVRDGNTDLSGLNRDITKAQYGTVDIGLKGGFTVDSSTVALVTSPIKTIAETYAALEKGYEDAAKTTEEIYEKSVVLYERTTNLINDKGFYTDKEIRINECIQMWNDDSKYGIGARLYEKYRGEILGDNFYHDSKAVTDLKLAYINLLGIDPTGSILGEVKGLRRGLYDNNQQINGGGIIYLDLSAQERGNILAFSAINKEIKNGEIVNYMIKLQKEDYEKYVTLELMKEAQYNKIVSLVVGISPLSPVKSALDIATGKDVITRDQLATSDYTLAASDILLLAAGPIGKVGKGLDAINDIAKMDRIVEAGSGGAYLVKYDAQFAAKQLIDNGNITESSLRSMVRHGAENEFIPSRTISEGYKYNFEINGTKLEVKWHSPDLNAKKLYPDSNSGNQWTAQIKVDGKLLGQDAKFHTPPPDNSTHIPVEFKK